jgi:hypothetical protein
MKAKFDAHVGQTTLLGATRAPLGQYFILKIFLEFFNKFFKKTLNFLKFFLILLCQGVYLKNPKICH